jgi:hypothetical protein
VAHQLLLLRQAVHGDEGQVQQAALVELGKVPLLLVVQATHIMHYGAHAGVNLCGTPRSCNSKAHQEGVTCGTASDELTHGSSMNSKSVVKHSYKAIVMSTRRA